MSYQAALSSDFANHLLSLLIGAALMFFLMRAACKRQVESAKVQLNIEKNEQFKIAITTSYEDVVRRKEHHNTLARQEGGDGKTPNWNEHYPQYAFYTQVYSYSLALQKHGWSNPTL